MTASEQGHLDIPAHYRTLNNFMGLSFEKLRSAEAVINNCNTEVKVQTHHMANSHCSTSQATLHLKGP